MNASLPVLLDDGTRKYVWGLGLAFAVDSSGNPIVYHTDGLGSVRALIGGSGDVGQSALPPVLTARRAEGHRAPPYVP